MMRRFARTLWPLAVLLLLLTWRAAGCRKKTPAPKAGVYPPHWTTPLLTAPPPRPTVTMWKGATRVPELPE